MRPMQATSSSCLSIFVRKAFYGIYDYWGAPKVEGLGGGLRALEESNQPIGVFMEYKDAPLALHAVNDSLQDLGDVTARWRVTLSNGEVVTEGAHDIRLGPDSHVRIGDLAFPVKQDQIYRSHWTWLPGTEGRLRTTSMSTRSTIRSARKVTRTEWIMNWA